MTGDQQAAQAQALNAATLNARRKVDQMAAGLGVKVLRILSVTDTTPPVVANQQYMQFFAGQRGAGDSADARVSAPAVFAPRTIDVRATVTVALEIAP